ncbi:hypothetical protein M501DRAFT_1020929 [Patellaria atrata CBS 101060]|uniref:BZIP domain-containing protein n=1 Tax=Patellaria atrata CBS 101060 TaxID=1346257 RepID=A0A9P4S176_9PEZI|nr:hypothetical protein M501DRAFT_1020929 [Patellaria atrata CBS 101060]
MDFTSYYASPQPFQFVGLPQGPSYAEEPKDHIDTSFIPTAYDQFHFTPTTTAPLIPASPPSSSHTPLPTASINPTPVEADREQRASSEEKETLTPAQSRRKAQNRAAQRAFRERKERHVKDLEAKLSALESSASSLQSDNERLKLALQRATTENEILRATSSTLSLPPSPTTPPEAYTATTAGLTRSGSSSMRNGNGWDVAGSMLPAGATWDLIQAHPLVKQGLVDIGDVTERLKRVARCNGQGPVFDEGEVWRAVEESRRAGGDELI